MTNTKVPKGSGSDPTPTLVGRISETGQEHWVYRLLLPKGLSGLPETQQCGRSRLPGAQRLAPGQLLGQQFHVAAQVEADSSDRFQPALLVAENHQDTGAVIYSGFGKSPQHFKVATSLSTAPGD